ncbi:MAG: hypothetical protein HUU20_02220 [Pirellulales bacterium]|nr:hypothetical protein [Pirellulales bacterium]
MTTPLRSDRRSFLSAISASPLAASVILGSSPGAEPANTPAPSGQPTAIDFSRSFIHYVPTSTPIWVRIQIECRLEVFDRTKGLSDEYVMSVRTQTGLWGDPAAGPLSPGYDFWMIFSKDRIYIKRVHPSSYNRNPSHIGLDQFVSTGWHLDRRPARPLGSGAEIKAALRAWHAVTARTEFLGSDGSRGFAIEYPVKWADGNDNETFRVETGPVLLLDPEKIQAGASLPYDDFQWGYLDYHSLDKTRCFLERPTSILSASTFQDSNRANPPLTAEQVGQIENRLYTGWEPPIPAENLRRLFETDHYSGMVYRSASTSLYVLES